MRTKEHKCDKSPYTFFPSIYQSDIIKEEWILDIFDAMIEIKYCPWCGVNLTEDKILKKCKSCNGNWESFQMSSEDECISCHLSKIDGSYMTS